MLWKAAQTVKHQACAKRLSHHHRRPSMFNRRLRPTLKSYLPKSSCLIVVDFVPSSPIKTYWDQLFLTLLPSANSPAPRAFLTPAYDHMNLLYMCSIPFGRLVLS